MRTVEEIEIDIKAEMTKRNEAEAALWALRKERDATRLASTGLEGHLVSYKHTTWRNRAGTEVRFVVRGMGRYGGGLVEGPVVRKDGTIGVKTVSASVGDLTDHGPYQPAA